MGSWKAFELSSLPGESHLPGCPALHCLNSQTLSEIGLSHRGQSDTLKKVNMVIVPILNDIQCQSFIMTR